MSSGEVTFEGFLVAGLDEDLREHFIALRVLGAEAVGLVNEDGGEFLEVAVQKRFQLANGLAQKAANAELAEDVWPRARTVLVEQVRRGDDSENRTSAGPLKAV